MCSPARRTGVARVPAHGQHLIYESGGWEVDLARRELRRHGTPVAIGSRAFEIIEALAEAAGELVTKDQLIGRVWHGAIVEDNTSRFTSLRFARRSAPIAEC
jgi:DNA-binding winged helix-turn-helix (wHTH) protein